MILIFLNLQDNILGPNPLTKNLAEVLKMLKVKSELPNLELITPVRSIMVKSMFSEVMGVLDILDNLLTIYMLSMLKLLNGNLLNPRVTLPMLEEVTLLL
jgi:hypothetical protein